MSALPSRDGQRQGELWPVPDHAGRAGRSWSRTPQLQCCWCPTTTSHGKGAWWASCTSAGWTAQATVTACRSCTPCSSGTLRPSARKTRLPSCCCSPTLRETAGGWPISSCRLALEAGQQVELSCIPYNATTNTNAGLHWQKLFQVERRF